jgi:hypothetical protein
MATQLNSDNYSTINDEMNTLLTSGAYAGINATIYNDANKTSIVTDANGPVQHRKITQITHVAAHMTSLGSQNDGSVTIIFSDGTSVTAVDGVDNYYYSLDGIIFQPRRFGSG